METHVYAPPEVCVGLTTPSKDGITWREGVGKERRRGGERLSVILKVFVRSILEDNFRLHKLYLDWF
jgi:hypothetical protein